MVIFGFSGYISLVTLVLSYNILGGRGMALSCLNVPVKINASGFLPQDTISIAFHGLEVAMRYTLKLVEGAIIIFILPKKTNH